MHPNRSFGASALRFFPLGWSGERREIFKLGTETIRPRVKIVVFILIMSAATPAFCWDVTSTFSIHPYKTRTITKGLGQGEVAPVVNLAPPEVLIVP